MSVRFHSPFLGFEGNAINPLTLVDLQLQRISYAIRSKPSWWTKYKDPEILAKWRNEILEQFGKREEANDERSQQPEYDGGEVDENDGAEVDENEEHEGEAGEDEDEEEEEEDEESEEADNNIDLSQIKVSQAEVDYILDELAGYETMLDEATGVQQSCYARIYESDSLISQNLLQSLKEAVKKLEDVPEDQKDWHPRSDEQVLDLVHPSLYCGVYGRTLAYPLDKAPHGRTSKDLNPLSLEAHGKHTEGWFDDWTRSYKFTWIPTDFDVNQGGDSAKALGYINNLHPSHHADLYKVIENLVARFTFLWDRVLTDVHLRNSMRYRIVGWYTWVDKKDEDDPEPDDEDFDDFVDYKEARTAWKERQPLTAPTVPEEGYVEDISERDVRYTVQGKKVQVIVKLANILLTPEKPTYPGGSWHVEGMINENIIASGIYYYDSENISESELAFRAAVKSDDIKYEQDDEVGMRRTYGLDRSKRSNQVVGAVKTITGRCIAFPNLYQHKVSPFELLDPTKPGHRKIVALFLVDPTKPIPSTTHIPPQQSDWLEEAMNTRGSLASKLPKELVDMVARAVESSGASMSLDEAKQYRLELMDERSVAVTRQTTEAYAVDFNLCEH